VQTGAGVARRSVQGALSQVHSSADQANFSRPVRTTPQLRSLSDFQGPTRTSSSSTKRRIRKSAGADRRCSQGALSPVHSSADQANFLRPVRTTPQLRSLSDFQCPTSASSSSTKRRVCIFRVFCLQERFSTHTHTFSLCVC
jgi:hypothetical protein